MTQRYDDAPKSAGNTFSEREVLAVEKLFSLLCTGSDTRVVMRSHEIRNVMRKFSSMRARLEARALDPRERPRGDAS